MDEQQLSD
jgi:hypothetical protein